MKLLILVRIVKENGNLVSDIKSKCLDGQSAVGLSLLTGDELAVLNWKTKAVSRINMKGEVIQVSSISGENGLKSKFSTKKM